MIIMGAMGYRKRTSFLAGLTVAQISEFSLILAGVGVKLGQIGNETLGLITLAGLITIGLSTYMIQHSHQLYNGLSRWLASFERRAPHAEQAADNDSKQQTPDEPGWKNGSVMRRIRNSWRHSPCETCLG